MVKTKGKNGYITIVAEGHPRAYLGRFFEHIIVMENYLGRFLPQGTVVHHKNCIRDDNRIENLLLLRNRDYHLALHSAMDNGDTAIVRALEDWSKEFMAKLKAGTPEEECSIKILGGAKNNQADADALEKFVVRRNKASNKIFMEFNGEVLINPDGKDIELDLERFGDPEEVFETDLTEKQFKVYQNKIKAKVAKEIADEKKLELQKKLFSELKRERMRLANKNNVPAYIIFEDKTLIEMAEIMPVSQSGMLHVWGMGSVKFRQYGNQFIDVIKKFKNDFKIV